MTEGELVLTAPESISCEAPPDFTLSGPALEALSGNRSELNTLVSSMAGGLTQLCDDLSSLTVVGEDRGVTFSFAIAKADGWTLPTGTEPGPAATASAPASEATPEPETEPESVAALEAPVVEPKIAPGLSLEQFASVFGPLQTMQGHVFLQRNDTWSRVLAARTYAENPGILSNDLDALEVARMLMTATEYQTFMGSNAGKNIQQISVFDRRDLANRVRTQLKPGLDQRRQTGPIKVYNTIPIRLGEYDFNSSSFPMDSRGLRNHQRPAWRNAMIQGAFDKFALPTRLNANVDQARQLDTYLRSRNDDRLYLAIFAQIEPNVPASLNNNYQQYRRPDGRLTKIALYADQGLTQTLYDFTADLAEQQVAIDAAFRILNQPIASGEDFIRAVGTLQDSDAPARAIADAYATSPNYGNTTADPNERRKEALAALGDPKGSTSLVFGGQVRFGPYDPVREVFPIQQLRPQHLQMTALPNMGFAAETNFVPVPTEIAVAPEVAAAITAAGQQSYFEMRLEAEMVQGSLQAVEGQYVQVRATLQPTKITVFGGQQGALPADRSLLADVPFTATAPAVPSLIEGLLDQN